MPAELVSPPGYSPRLAGGCLLGLSVWGLFSVGVHTSCLFVYLNLLFFFFKDNSHIGFGLTLTASF